MQLGSRETENERFAHYLTKTYRKTASLIANALKAVSKPGNQHATRIAMAIAFQIAVASAVAIANSKQIDLADCVCHCAHLGGRWLWIGVDWPATDFEIFALNYRFQFRF